MREDVGCDSLARRDDRNPGRVAHHELSRDEAGRFLHRNATLLRVERLLRRHHDLGVDVFVVEKSDWALLALALDFLKRGNKALDVHHAVAARDDRKEVADVTEFDLYAVVVAEVVVDLDAGKADVTRVDGELCAVERKDGITVDKFGAERIIAAKGVYLLARVVGEIHRLLVHRTTLEKEVFAGNVERRQKKIRCGSRLRESDDLSDVVWVHWTTRQ